MLVHQRVIYIFLEYSQPQLHPTTTPIPAPLHPKGWGLITSRTSKRAAPGVATAAWKVDDFFVGVPSGKLLDNYGKIHHFQWVIPL